MGKLSNCKVNQPSYAVIWVWPFGTGILGVPGSNGHTLAQGGFAPIANRVQAELCTLGFPRERGTSLIKQ